MFPLHRYETIRTAIEERERKLRHVIVQMRMSGAARCFAAWAGLCVGTGASRDRVMRSVLGRIQSRALSLCLTAWAEWHAEAMSLRAYYASRWLNMLTSKVFVAWAEDTFGDALRRGVLDVAGGSGDVAFALWARGIAQS